MTDRNSLKAEALAALEGAFRKNKEGRLYQSRRIVRTTARNRKSGPSEILLTLVWRMPSGTKAEIELVAIPASRWRDFDVITAAVCRQLEQLRTRQNLLMFPQRESA